VNFANILHFALANKPMVPTVSQIMTKNETFPLKQRTTCANCGIHMATCVLCHQQYVGQTVNKFSTRWSSHQSTWNKPDNRDDSDQMAVSQHYSVYHGITNKPSIYDH